MNHTERLQNAAPAAPTPVLDRDAVFAAIVAQPGDLVVTSNPRRSRSSRRKLTIALVVVALAALTTATAFATGAIGWHDETAIVQKPQQWEALYRAATNRLTLPPGETWPQRTLPPNTITGMSEPGGMAVAISRVRWECYWGNAIRSGNTGAQARSQAALADINANHTLVAPDGSSENVAPPANLQGPFEIFADDGGIQFVTKMYADAADGKPAMLFQSCRVNS
ncbi:MAG: hypothetical protein QOJ31_197 [Gaiellales bacterium]|nr:hypothetical protein [Gaiellales bacterium]